MGALQGALGLWAQGFRPSEPPTGRLHRLCVVGLVGLLGARQGIHHARALGVVVLVDVASLVLAVHGLALHAAVVLLLLEAAADVLLCTGGSCDKASLVLLSARVAMLHCALLVSLGQGFVTSTARVLF